MPAIRKYTSYNGHLAELAQRFPAFKKLTGISVIKHDANCWRNIETGAVTNEILIAFFGKSGYGKSSTLNTLLGQQLMETSDTDACTRTCNCMDYEIAPGNILSLADFPGTGESTDRNSEYLKLYEDFLECVDVVVYVVRADTRDHSIDEQAFGTLFKTHSQKGKVIIAVNQCDKVEPLNRSSPAEPTAEQVENIQKKISFLQEKFNTGNKIIPYSAATGWNMNALAEEIVDTVLTPNTTNDIPSLSALIENACQGLPLSLNLFGTKETLKSRHSREGGNPAVTAGSRLRESDEKRLIQSSPKKKSSAHMHSGLLGLSDRISELLLQINQQAHQENRTKSDSLKENSPSKATKIKVRRKVR